MTEHTSLGTERSTAVIDNGSFGTREITFSTGRLARQAAGSVIVQLGDTVVLSATTAGKQPKEHFDFFPLTVVVETVLALDPAHPYDVVAMNAASMSTKLSGLPFSGPVGATRVAHIDGQWVAFPTIEELERATFDMVVAGRVLADGDVAIMMVEAEATPNAVKLISGGATAPTEEVVAGGLEAA